MSIIARVRLDSFDFAHPREKQTQVYVEIPDVARASYLLPAEMFHGLRDRAWPEVLDAAHDYYAHSGIVSDSTSAATRAAVRAWLLEDPNRDEMQAAWEQDQARQHPVARKLLAENQQLRAQVAELDKKAVEARAERADQHDDLAHALGRSIGTEWSDLISIAASAVNAEESARQLRARVAELEAAGLIDEQQPVPFVLTEEAEAEARRSANVLGAMVRREWCTGCNTDHAPADCGYRPGGER